MDFWYKDDDTSGSMINGGFQRRPCSNLIHKFSKLKRRLSDNYHEIIYAGSLKRRFELAVIKKYNKEETGVFSGIMKKIKEQVEFFPFICIITLISKDKYKARNNYLLKTKSDVKFEHFNNNTSMEKKRKIVISCKRCTKYLRFLDNLNINYEFRLFKCENCNTAYLESKENESKSSCLHLIRNYNNGQYALNTKLMETDLLNTAIRDEI